MKPSITLIRSSEERSDRGPLRLKSVRARHMFDQARIILDLCADGNEKLSGAYIFDGHYIFSLVDKIIDHSREMVSDTSILAPEGIRSCYDDFDSCKLAAEKLFLKREARDGDDASGDDSADAFENTAEYRLLKRALDWIGCHGEKPRASVIGLLNRVLNHLFNAFEKDAEQMHSEYRLDISCPGIRNHIQCADMGAAIRHRPDGTVSFEDLNCRPLILLARGAMQRSESCFSPGSENLKKWWALADGDTLSLFRMASGSPVWLEVSLVSDRGTGHVLLWAPADEIDAQKILPECRVDMFSGAAMVWQSGGENSTIKHVLTALGGVLFSPPAKTGRRE